MQFPLVCALVSIATAPLLVRGHTAAFAKGMYCLNGPDGNNLNANDPCWPLYNEKKEDWWFQNDRGCADAPPADGDLLELPAGGSFTVELAHNQAFTTLSWDGMKATDWPDGVDHPSDWNGGTADDECVVDGALHTYNQSTASGTAWAISYNANKDDVALDNLVVFTTKQHTPWKRVTSYDVPAGMPECPAGGCHCVFLWVASICGQQNMYFQPYKCEVTGSTGTKALAAPKAPKYCNGPGATDACVSGAKQPIILNQASGNNVDALPQPVWGGVYNYGYGDDSFGFGNGALTDIFASGSDDTAAGSAAAPTTVTTAKATTSSIKASSTTTKKASTTEVAATEATSSTTRHFHNNLAVPTSASAATSQTAQSKPKKCTSRSRAKRI